MQEAGIEVVTDEARQVLTSACLYAIVQNMGGEVFIPSDLLEKELNTDDGLDFQLKAVTDSLYSLKLRKIPMIDAEATDCTSSESTQDSPEQ